MKRDSDGRRKARGHDVIRSVASDERNAALFYEVGNVGVIASESIGIRPGPQSRAPLPTTCVEKDDIACRHFHMLKLFHRLEGLAMNGRSRLEPPLRSSLPRQTRRIEEDGSSRERPFIARTSRRWKS